MENMRKFGIGERAPWHDFPDVIRNGELKSLSNEPEYEAAKGGDWDAATQLVQRVLTDAVVEHVLELIGSRKPKLLPVRAIEESGRNKIPLVVAEILAERMSLDVEMDIIQSDRVYRTNSGADHRLAFTPTFEGTVIPGQAYFLIDDTLAMGGTLAALRGFVENRQGKVLGAMVMTAHEGSLHLPVRQELLNKIYQKHGHVINEFWKEQFEYGIDQLTQAEAGHLRAARTFDAIRERIITARNEGCQSFNKRKIEKSETTITGKEKIKPDLDLEL